MTNAEMFGVPPVVRAQAEAWRDLTTLHSLVDREAVSKVLVGDLRLNVLMLLDSITVSKKKIDRIIDSISDAGA